MNKQERVLYDTEITEEYLNYAREELVENGYEDITDEKIWERAEEIKRFDYDDLKEIFSQLRTKGNIIAIADVGRWNGRVTASRKFSTDLDDIFYLLSDYDAIKVYVDEKDLRIVGAHHDATDYILLRSFKSTITEEQEDNFESLIHTKEGVNNRQLGYYTESIRPLIADYYGF